MDDERRSPEIVDDLPQAGRPATASPAVPGLPSPRVRQGLADLCLWLALLGAVLIPVLFVASQLGISLIKLSDSVTSWAKWWAVVYFLCLLPAIAAIVSGQMALNRKKSLLVFPGALLFAVLLVVVLAFWPSSDGPFLSLALNIILGVTYAPLFAVMMLFFEARRDYRLVRGRPRVPGEAAAVSGVLLGWLETGVVAWLVLIAFLGGGHPLRALLLLGGLFAWNSTVLIGLLVRYELGNLLRASANHLRGRLATSS